MKPLVFLGSSRDDLRAFPVEARRRAGFQLDLVQQGFDPDDYRPMPSVGRGVREIRVREEAGSFRVIYVANRGDAVYVLHAFQKKTETTTRQDLSLARRRLQQVLSREG